MNFRLRWTLALLLTAAPLHAQEVGSVYGRVLDARDNRPVAGATVTVEDAGARTVTDAAGAYRVARLPAGRHRVAVRALGYGRMVFTVEVGAGAAVRRDAGLTAASIPLDELVVTGTVTPTEVRAVPNAVSVITAEQIERRGVTRMQDALRTELPGLFAQDVPAGSAAERGASSARLFARGSSNLGSAGASPPKIYVDGVLFTDASQINAIDPRSVERIEYVPGPQASSLYGSGAINGVMQIFLKKGDFGVARPRVRVEASAGTIQNNFDSRVVPSQHHRLEVSGARGPVSYQLGGSYAAEGEWIPGRTEERAGVDGGMRLVAGALTASATARLAWLGFDGNSRPFERRAIRAGERRLDTPLLVSGTDLADRWAHQTLGLGLSYTARSWWRHELTGGIDARRTTLRTPPQYASLADTLFRLADTDGRTTTLRYATTLDVPLRGPIHPTLVMGAEYNGLNTVSGSGTGTLDEGSFTPTSYSRNTGRGTGLFAQAQVGFWDALFLTGGVRGEDNRAYGPDYGRSVDPRVGVALVRGFGPVTAKVRGAYGRATRPPNAFARLDRFDVTFEGTRYMSQRGNPAVGPEVQRGGEVGADLAWDDVASLGVTAFRQTAEDLLGTLLTFVTDSSVVNDFGAPLQFFQSQTVNVGRVRNTGVEVQGTARLGPVALRGTFATADSRVLRLNNPDDPRYATAAALVGPARRSGSLDGRWEGRRATLGAHLTYVGPVRLDRNDALVEEALNARLLPRSPRVYNPFESFTAGSYTAGEYALVDVTATYRVRREGEVFLNAFNIGDFYQNDASNTAVARGRRMLAGVRVTF
ncbi:MAG TPA: TonB-dependent receptor [Longimicrobium sp.]|nr:TonB-dependent receptor [Longimicrobium sp.]